MHGISQRVAVNVSLMITLINIVIMLRQGYVIRDAQQTTLVKFYGLYFRPVSVNTNLRTVMMAFFQLKINNSTHNKNKPHNF